MKEDIDQNQNLNGIQKDLRHIQVNTIRYFNKDYQTFLFLRFNDPKKSRNWISQLVPEITTTQDVKAFNDLFNIVKHHSSREELAGSIHFRKKHNYYTLGTMLGGLSKKADLPKVDAPNLPKLAA